MSAVSAPDQEMYVQLKLLGEGSFGKAYLVRCESDGSLCVIKKMEMKSMSELEKQETIREAHILEALNHPNIVRFREVYKTKRNQLCIVMDYCDGGDLSKKILEHKGRFIPENQVLDWFTQICLALKHVHDRKIVHRDLKAQNIFLNKDNTLKVGDFGIAKVLRHTRENCKTMVGTPYYISPEIIESKPYSFRSDVWSLGVILYEMCTQKPPFDGIGLPQLALKIVGGKYNPISSYYSKEMSNLIAILLNIEPLKRPQVNQILKMPIIANRIRKFLSDNVLQNEFSHTVLHNRNFVNNNLNIDNIPLPKPYPPPQQQQSSVQPLERQPSAPTNVRQQIHNPQQQQQQQPQIEGFLSPQNKNINQYPPKLHNAPSTPNIAYVAGGYQPYPQNKQIQQVVIQQQIGPLQKKPVVLAGYNNPVQGKDDKHLYLYKQKNESPFIKQVVTPKVVVAAPEFHQVDDGRRIVQYGQNNILPEKLKREVSEPILFQKPKPLFEGNNEYKKQQQQQYQQQLQNLANKDKMFEKKIENMRADLAQKKEIDLSRYSEQSRTEDTPLSAPSNPNPPGIYNPNNYKGGVQGYPKKEYLAAPSSQSNNSQSKKNIHNQIDQNDDKERRKLKAEEERQHMIQDIKLRRSKLKETEEFSQAEGVPKQQQQQQQNHLPLQRDIPIEIFIPQNQKNQKEQIKVPEKYNNNRYPKNGLVNIGDSPTRKTSVIPEKEDISYFPKYNPEIVSKLMELNLSNEEDQKPDEFDQNMNENELLIELDKSVSEIQNRFKQREVRVVLDDDESSSDEDRIISVIEEKECDDIDDDEDSDENSHNEREPSNFKSQLQKQKGNSSSNDEDDFDPDLFLKKKHCMASEKGPKISGQKLPTEQPRKRAVSENVPLIRFNESNQDTLRYVLESRLGKQLFATTLKQIRGFMNGEIDSGQKQSDNQDLLLDFNLLNDLSSIFVTLPKELAEEVGPLIILYYNNSLNQMY